MSHRYTPHNWSVGEVLTEARMDAIETGIDRAVDLSGDTMTGLLNLNMPLPTIQFTLSNNTSLNTRLEDNTFTDGDKLTHHFYIAQHAPNSTDATAYELFHLPRTYENITRTNYRIFTSKGATAGAVYFNNYASNDLDHDLSYGTLPIKYGGTGLTTTGTPGQVLAVNAAGTGLTWVNNGSSGETINLERLTKRVDRISGSIYYDTADIINFEAKAISSTGATITHNRSRTTNFIRVVKGDFIHYGGVAAQGYFSVAMYTEQDETTFTNEWYRYWDTTTDVQTQHIIPILKNGYIKCSWTISSVPVSGEDTQDYTPYMSFCLYRTAISRALTTAHRDWFNLSIPQTSKISIIGDSISTYKGYSIANDSGAHYPSYDLLLPSYTWWMRVINASGGTLIANASVGDSGVTKLSTDVPSFYERARNSFLGAADVIYVAVGSIDSLRNVELGEYNYSNTAIANLDETYFRTGYIKGLRALMYNYPNATIVCVILKMQEAYAESIKNIATHYGIRWIENQNYELDDSTLSNNIYPNITGMAQIATDVLWQPDKSLSIKNTPADSGAVHKIIERLDNITGNIQFLPEQIQYLSAQYIKDNGTTIAANYGRVTDFISVKAGDIIYYTGFASTGRLSVAMYTSANESDFSGEWYGYRTTTSTADELHIIPIIYDGYVKIGWWIYDNTTLTDYLSNCSATIYRGIFSKTLQFFQKNFVSTYIYPGKISIIGDSISSYRGLSDRVSNDPSPLYPQSDLRSPFDTWWMKIILSANGQLDTNNSYAGSFVTKRSETAYADRPSFFDRAHAGSVGAADVVLVALGTNDSLNHVDLGSYDYTTPQIANLDETKFRTGYIKGLRALMYNYPNAQIICIAMSMENEYAESIREIAAHYGVKFIDARGYDGIVEGNVHPGLKGMKQIATSIISNLDSSLTISNMAADAKSIGEKISNLEQRIYALENNS